MPTNQASRINERDDEVSRTEDPPDIPASQPSDESQLVEPSLFEKIILIITNANRVKRRLNEDKRSRRDDPEQEGSVSADEEEDTVPDRLAFDLMAETLHMETMRTPAVPAQPTADLPSTHISTQQETLAIHDPVEPARLANEPNPPGTVN